MQDMEFTVETVSFTCSRPVTVRERLRLLSKIARDLVEEGNENKGRGRRNDRPQKP
jgi:hypothetical protein